MINTIRSEKGFGIIQVLGALLIVTIAVAGLFLSSYYSHHKANENYHYRVALLKAMQKLEEVKYYNMHNNGSVDLRDVTTGNFVIDDQGEDDVEGTLGITKVRRNDLAIANYVAYDIVTVKVNWQDGPEEYLNTILNQPKELELREDYFYRTDVVTP